MLLSFLALATPAAASWSNQAPIIPPSAQHPFIPSLELAPNSHDFTLRNIFHHGTYRDPGLHKRLDVRPDMLLYSEDEGGNREAFSHPSYRVSSQPSKIERLKDRGLETMEEYMAEARYTGHAVRTVADDWTVDDIAGPNITDKETVISLALITANAYVKSWDDAEWEDVGSGYNRSESFGWHGEGLRGHIFADKDNSTVIVSLKGTSPAVFDGEGTTTDDKLNDNLFFSCCCGQGGQYLWRQVCDCQSSTYTCNQTCLVKSLKARTKYYQAAIELYTNVTDLYPDSNIWLAGHSLGGAVSSLLGMTFGIPVVTFEAPGEALAAARLGLPTPPHTKHSRSYTGAYHFGQTADPIFMGTCNSATAACTLGGYAMESQCHTGKVCIYDTVSDNGWRVGIGNHKIHNVIDQVIRKYDKVPACEADEECVDCFNWKYFESNGTETSTSSTSTGATSTTSTTRTTTCKTPGWWGCLDPTTTTHYSNRTITETFTTTSCRTPGWFGCNDPVTMTVTTTETKEVPITSWSTSTAFTGAKSAPSTALATATSTSSAPKSTSATGPKHQHTSCRHPGFFWGCKDKATHATSTSSPRPTSSITDAPVTKTTTVAGTSMEHTCTSTAFFGLICLDPRSDDVPTSTKSRKHPHRTTEI